MIFHAVNNAVGQFFPSLFSDAYVAQLALLQGVVCIMIALLVLATKWRFWTIRPALLFSSSTSAGTLQIRSHGPFQKR
jgi:hypothetical protein